MLENVRHGKQPGESLDFRSLDHYIGHLTALQGLSIVVTLIDSDPCQSACIQTVHSVKRRLDILVIRVDLGGSRRSGRIRVDLGGRVWHC